MVIASAYICVPIPCCQETDNGTEFGNAELQSGDLSSLGAVPLVIAAGGGGAGASDYCCG